MLRDIGKLNDEAMPVLSSPHVVRKSVDTENFLCGSAEFDEGGIAPTRHCEGSMTAKIKFLKRQVANLEDEIARVAKDTTASSDKLWEFIEQKTQIEKTLKLMEKTKVKAVVAKRDSMEHTRESSDNCIHVASMDNQHMADEPLRPNTFAMPPKEYSIDDMGFLARSDGSKERESATLVWLKTGCSEQSRSFHASDYLFLSSKSFRSPSCHNLSVTSRESFRCHPEGRTRNILEEGLSESNISDDEGMSQKDEQYEEAEPTKAEELKHSRRGSIAASLAGMFIGLGAEITSQSFCDATSKHAKNDVSKMTKGRTYSIG